MRENMFRFSLKYFLATLILFGVEVAIALFIHDNFIRPYVGDILIVVFLYTSVKTVYSMPTKKLPYYLFALGCLMEVLQSLNLVGKLGLSGNKVASVILGTTFDIKDIVCYFIGMVLLVIWEQLLRKNIAYL